MVNTTRREFLKRTAAAITAPVILRSTALGKNAPSNRVNLALIGAGGRGNQLLNDFSHVQDAQVIAVCDCFKERRETTRDKLNKTYNGEVVTAYADFRELLALKDIDGVIVATPDHWHVPIAIAAARAGKDTYVEKPLGVSMEWAWKLRKAARRAKTVFQYGTQQRSSPLFRKACELVRNGYIGEVRRIEAWCPDISSQYAAFHVPQYGSTDTAPVPEGFDYDRWLGPAQQKPYTVDRCTNFGAYHIYDYALGFIAGWGAHPLDIAQWGLNVDHTSPVRYEGTGSIPAKGLYDTIDSWDMECTYATGVKMRFMGHRVAQPVVSAYRKWNDHGTTFHGGNGWISVDRGGIYASDPKLLEITLKADDVHLRREDSHAHDFVMCMKSRQLPLSHLEAAIRSDTISHLCDIAIRLRKPIEWDPEKERIVGDKEAAKMLARPLRKPWNLNKRMLT
ncbi:MAG: Gfo/Idh/MocA family oxidoreductase [Candidatus Hydrogenedentes bacterium]|nr:Gfo/Idh/MocA family oxidoreductase [Candidatus Hydrogenedentota bacterium]